MLNVFVHYLVSLLKMDSFPWCSDSASQANCSFIYSFMNLVTIESDTVLNTVAGLKNMTVSIPQELSVVGENRYNE